MNSNTPKPKKKFHPRHQQKPWGNSHTLTLNEKCTVKIIKIKAKERTSLQRHRLREETWVLLTGKIKALIGEIEHIIGVPNVSITIPRTKWHRLQGIKDSLVLEISRGYFDEKDIQRKKDDERT